MERGRAAGDAGHSRAWLKSCSCLALEGQGSLPEKACVNAYPGVESLGMQLKRCLQAALVIASCSIAPVGRNTKIVSFLQPATICTAERSRQLQQLTAAATNINTINYT